MPPKAKVTKDMAILMLPLRLSVNQGRRTSMQGLLQRD